jgi:NitT/TauT family transport system substrate-binding protein
MKRPIALLLSTILALAAAGLAHAQGKPLKKVQFGIGALSLNVTYPWAMMPPVLGYWREEGYDVEVIPAQGSLQAVQLLTAGKLDFIEANSGPIMQASATNGIPVRTVMLNTVIDWSLVSKEDGPIRKIRDFKGKLIGVSSLGTGGVALLKSYLSANGMDAEKDVTLVAVGVGPAALLALRTDRVQGLMYWGAAINSFEVTGAKFNYFFDPIWRKYPDFSIATLQSTIDKDPAMALALVRGAAKASLFSMANPDCVRRLQWAKYPDTKPTGAAEDVLIKGDLYRLKGQQDGMQQALDVGGGKLWGKVTAKDFATLEDFFIDTKVLTKKLANPADYLVAIPDFFEKANDFDHDAVIKQAKDCKVP